MVRKNIGGSMDKIQSILINAFLYELTSMAPIANDKAPTWWPHIVREYSPDKWATSPDPDSYPVDGANEPLRLGSKDVYDWVQDAIFSKLLTGEEKKIVYAFLGRGYVQSASIASKKLGIKKDQAAFQYGKILLKIKNSFPSHLIDVYFSMI